MKILFLTDDFPPKSFGGAGIVAYNLAKELEDKGYKVFIITSVQDKSKQGREKYEGLIIYRIYSNYHPRWRNWLSLYNPQIVSKIKKIIKEIKPDIVHAHNIHHYLSYHCLKIAKKYSKAVFLTAHDVMLIHYGKLMFTRRSFSEGGPKYPKDYKITICDQIKEAQKRYNPFRNIIIRHYLKYIDKIFAVSNSLKKVLEINGIKNIETVYNRIDVDDRKVDDLEIKNFKEKYNLQNKKIILFGGRLSGAKGGNQILKAIALIRKEINNIVLLIAGERNQYVKEMEELTRKLSIKGNIIFTGWLEKDSLKLAYHSVDICVVPSICFDSFPTANLEAMASKKPIIGTCFGGTPEIVIDNKTGYIVDPDNIELMAEKIIDLLKNPQKAKQFGEAGYQRVREKFSLEKQIRETLKWYLHLFKEKPGNEEIENLR